MASSATHEMGRSGTRHQLAEVVEEVAGVVGPGAGLGMVLARKGGFVAEGEALDRVVVEVHVREPHGSGAGSRPQSPRRGLAGAARRRPAAAGGIAGGIQPRTG